MTVFVISGTGARRLALLALAFTGATIICARTFFFVRIFRIVGFVAVADIVRIA